MECGKCEICDEQASQTCAHCGVTGYCGREHQKQHWSLHKNVCKSYKIETSAALGRHMVASRDMKPGELIVKELPLVMGPRMDSVPLCLGCYRPALPPQGSPRLCSRCNIAPICSEACEAQSAHSPVECTLLERLSRAVPEDWTLSENLQVMLPLRCLLLRPEGGAPSDKWDSLMQLQAHTKERRDTAIWHLHKEKVVDCFRSAGILTSDEDELLMQTICGVLDVNCFELRGPNPALMTHSGRHGERLRGVYLQAALMSHDCVGNTHLSVDDNYNMTIHASLPIAAGGPVLFNYASALESTPERFQRLREGKYFCCSCRRCSDPTELGTYMSAIWCSRCREGKVVPSTPLHQTDGLDRWRCERCDHNYHPRLLRTTMSQAWGEIEDADNGDIRSMEALLAKLSRSFPPTNVVMVEVKQNLVALYREVILREPSPSRKAMQRKIALCDELLQVLTVLEPGISRLRGITLYELHVPKVMLANREYDGGEISSSQLLSKLIDAENTLKDAISQLLYEPSNSPEGRLVKLAMDEMRVLRENIQDVKVLSEQQSSGDGRKGNKRKIYGKKSKK